MPKPEPIEYEIIERATRFDATIFLGVGRFHTETFDSLDAARARAALMAGEAKNGRKGMVYAITPEGRSAFVPAHYQPRLIEKETEMTTTNLSTTQIAQLSAIMTGGGFKRANSKDAAIKRFLNVATEAGIKAPAGFLDIDDFDLAAGHLRAELDILKAGDQVAAMEAKAEATTKPRKRAPVAVKAPAKAEKPAKAPKAEKPAKADKAIGKRAAILAAAEAGTLPPVPDFSAETHKRFRAKLAQVVALAEAGDIKGLEAFEINPVSSSPKAIDKYRNLAVIALKARAAQGKAA